MRCRRPQRRRRARRTRGRPAPRRIGVALAPLRGRARAGCIRAIVIAVTAWFALAVWSFAGPGIVNYLLFIVSGFMFVAVALPLILSRVGHDGGAATRDENAPSLRDWAKWEYETSAGKVSGAEAAAQILLPIAAAAVGMTAIGMIFYFSAPAGA